ncbi:hypothetical protein Phi2_0020 [Vibrio phage phi 2]|uniref:hypothetical protein n=1 Tax=Vibrio phage X29 TaxID=1500713 RepID=UPI00045FDA7C|nr:hypothetical protein SBVcX29_0051 [Vibrio phage X29]AIA10330.1 hypothetical protein SBVcX29_0051 [Vibrio phage X29]AIU39706.1 hypothetical protein Phi2_0020 [Vibrio phage phi 2]
MRPVMGRKFKPESNMVEIESQKKMVIESVKAMIDNSDFNSDEKIVLLAAIAAAELERQNLTEVRFAFQKYEIYLKIKLGELNNA